MPWGAVAGAVASSVVGSALSPKPKSAKAAPFTPVNFYTPGGSVTWNGKTGTAALSPDVNGLRNNYLGQANNYNSSLSAFYGPDRSQFTHINAGYTPKSYADYYAQLSPQFTTAGTPGNANAGLTYGRMSPVEGGYNGFGGGFTRGSAGTSSSVNQSGLDAAIRDAMARDQQANTTFDQAGYDAAKGQQGSPEQHMYDLMRQLSQPGEQQDRTDLESRLFAQGMLGSANGQGYNPQMKALDDSQQQAQLGRELTALTTTPDLMTKYQNLYNSAANGVSGIDTNLNDILKTSGNIGIQQGSNTIQNAAVQNQIQQGSGNFWGSAAGSIGQAVGNGVNSIFKTPDPTINMYSPYTASNYTPQGAPGVNFNGINTSNLFGNY